MSEELDRYEPIEIDIDDGCDDEGFTIHRVVYVCGYCHGHLEWADMRKGICHHCGKGIGRND